MRTRRSRTFTLIVVPGAVAAFYSSLVERRWSHARRNRRRVILNTRDQVREAPVRSTETAAPYEAQAAGEVSDGAGAHMSLG